MANRSERAPVARRSNQAVETDVVAVYVSDAETSGTAPAVWSRPGLGARGWTENNLFLVTDAPTGRIVQHLGNTDTFVERVRSMAQQFAFVRDTLAETILSQRALLQYNSLYMTFLMGQITEEEFEDSAEVFIREPECPDGSVLGQKIRVLEEETGIAFTLEELADVFHCLDQDVSAAWGNRTLRTQTASA